MKISGKKYSRNRTAWASESLRFFLLLVLGVLGIAGPSFAALPDIDPTCTYIEAENYNAMGAPNPYAWEIQDFVSGYTSDGDLVNDGYLYTTTGGTNATPQGARTDYKVNFTTSGTYYIWLRARDEAGRDGGDSTFWGIDGQMVGAITETTDDVWTWTNNEHYPSNSVSVTAGAHTLNLWPREAGQHTDGFIISTSPNPHSLTDGNTTFDVYASTCTIINPAAATSSTSYIEIPFEQSLNGNPLDVTTTQVDSGDLLYNTDLTNARQYRALGGETDGFNEFAVEDKWTKTDVGGDTTPAPSVSSGLLNLTGSGQDIWNTKDYFTYLYQGDKGGDFTVDVKVESIQNTHSWAKAGIMVRQGLATTSKHAMIVITPGNGVSFQRRLNDGGPSASTTTGGITAPRWLRLKRAGNIFTGYYSSDGITWTTVGSDTVTMTDPVAVGLAVTSHDSAQDCLAKFDNFLFMPAGTSGMNETWSATTTAIDTTGWAAGDYGVSIRGTSTESGVVAANTFYWDSCVDPDPSTITIANGQTVSGSTVSLPSLYEHTGDVGSFTYQIDGVAVTDPWNSLEMVPEGTFKDVNFKVVGTDPDCGQTISASNTITVDNTCSDPDPSTITILTGQTTGGSSVDLTTLFETTGDVGSFSYKVNGTSVTSPWNSTAYGTTGPETVTLEVRGTDPDCGSIIVASNSVDIDNTCTRIDPTISFDSDLKYAAAGETIEYTVTIYNNDSLNCSSQTFDLALVSDSNTTGFNASSVIGGTGLIIAGGGSASAALRVQPKSTAAEWLENDTTIQVTSNLPHSTVSDYAKTVVFLVSPITHNSVTTKSNKWGGNWGTSETGSKYGNFTCLTCHEKNSPNVKWMKTTVATPDGSNWGISGYNSLSVSFTDARDGSADWGSDDPNNDGTGRVGSTKSCEVCHSITDYHRYDTNTDPDGAGPLTGQTNLSHFNNRACIDCHRHSDGFTAHCDYCHGDPPLDDVLGAGGLANLPAATGSTTAGTHYKHVKILDYPCTYCHNGYRTPGEMPKEVNGYQDINLKFDVFERVSGDIDYTAATAGSYTGQDGVSYDGVVVASGQGTLICANIYCHGGTDSMGGTNPKWNGTITCASCHGVSASNTPPGYSHTTHVGEMGLACTECHGSTPIPGSNGHVNGKVKWDVSALAGKNGTPAYRGVAAGETTTLAPSGAYGGYGTCSNIACHYGTVTPPWNNGDQPATCTTCHRNGTDDGLLVHAAPATGAHNDHVDPTPGTINETMIATFVNKCESCHGAGANTGEHDGHIDFATDFSVGFTYNSTDGSCANYCHATDAGPNDWFSTVALPCHYCHMPRPDGASYIGPAVVFPGGTGAPDAAHNPYGSHMKVAKADTFGATTDWDLQCRKCHPYHEGGVTVPLPPTNWTAATGTSSPMMGTNMQEKLGLQFPVTGGIHLGGSATTGSTEAEICWNCHGTDDTINEWGFNADTNDAFPTAAAQGTVNPGPSHNYGHLYSDSGWTTLTPFWVDTNAKGMYRKDYYQHSTATTPDYVLSQRISSVHSADFGLTEAQGSSVYNNIDGTGQVIRSNSQVLESRDKIRCTYCHDVHDMNRALVDLNNSTAESSTGRPYLRGSWMGNPYGPDVPPISGYSYPTTGGYHGYGSRFASLGSENNRGGDMAFSTAVPRLFTDTDQRIGGYFIDQNSGWPSSGRAEDLSDTAGICVLCHGNDVNNMDYYSASMWRTGMTNGHSNAALGGTGTKKADLFDARRGGTGRMWMAAQEGVNWREYGKNPPGGGYMPREIGPFRGDFYNTNPDKPAKDRAEGSPPRNLGWYGGTPGSTTRGGQYDAWYSSGGIGTNSGSAGRAHDFTCSKCHSPHASGLPALLITNCLDKSVANWSGGNGGGPNGSSTTAQNVANNCHRKESTGTGWHRLAPGQ